LQLFKELQRRNVFRVAIGYVVSSWFLAQVADLVLENTGAPDWVMQTILLVLALGFPVVVFFSWAYEVTPEGIKRESEVDRTQSTTQVTGRKLDRAITGVLVIALAYFAYDKFVLSEDREAALVDAAMQTATEQAASADVSTQSSKSVAVLPFAALSSGEDDGYFADGLTEEILNSLAALPELLVTARTSSFHFKDLNLPIPEIAATLGVDNVVEGSVRRSGNQLRITAQLIRAADGFHLWSQTYDRTVDDVFAVQEDIATSIAETLNVLLNDTRRESMRTAGIGNVEAFIAYQKGQELADQAHQGSTLSQTQSILI
jgi:adenylate cyclase